MNNKAYEDFLIWYAGTMEPIDHRPAYYLKYKDGLGPYWKCFDGDNGKCMSTQKTEQDARAWCRGYNYTKNFFAPTTCTTDSLQDVSKKVPCPEKGNNPMLTIDHTDCWSNPTPKKPQFTAANAQSVIQVITDSKPDTVVDQRKFLISRVHSIKYDKLQEIAEQFYLHEPHGPTTVAELKERLKKGLYTVELPKHSDDDDDEIYWRDAFSWRTPETQYDKVGYKTACSELYTFIDDITDQIAILDPKDGLGLLEDLKKWKPAKAKK